jgi:hypothetical protein
LFESQTFEKADGKKKVSNLILIFKSLQILYLKCCAILATELWTSILKSCANEVGGAFGTHGRGEKSVQGFGGKTRRKETTGKTKA